MGALSWRDEELKYGQWTIWRFMVNNHGLELFLNSIPNMKFANAM